MQKIKFTFIDEKSTVACETEYTVSCFAIVEIDDTDFYLSEVSLEKTTTRTYSDGKLVFEKTDENPIYEFIDQKKNPLWERIANEISWEPTATTVAVTH